MRNPKLGSALGSVVLGVVMMIATTVTIATSASPAGASGTPIKIGTTYWNLPAVVLNVRLPGLRAAVRAINKSGGIHGHPLQLVECGAADANGLEACAHQFVSEGVVATIGDAALIDEIPVGQILAKGGVPQIDPFDTAPQSFNNPNVYMTNSGIAIQYANTLYGAKQRHYKTYHFIEGVSSSAAQIESLIAKASAYYGIKATGATTEVPITAADLSTYVADASSAGAGMSICTIAPFESNLLLQASQQLGKKLIIGLDNQFTPQNLKQFGEAGGPLSGAIIVDSYPPASASNVYPALKTYKANMAAEFKAGDSLANPAVVNPATVENWLNVEVFAEIAKSLKTVTASTVKHALNTEKNINMLGLLPPWTPSKKGPAGFSRVSQPWLYLMTVKNGQTVLVQDKPFNGLTAIMK